MIKIEDYAHEVLQMRELQKTYFKTRNPKTLGDSINQERRVDKMTKNILLPSLFE